MMKDLLGYEYPVQLDYPADPLCLHIIQTLEAALGLETGSAILHGGALRDIHRLGLTPKDYDINLPLAALTSPELLHSGNTEAISAYISERLKGIGKINRLKVKTPDTGTVNVNCNILWNDEEYGTYELDLYFSSTAYTCEESAMAGDAPINCIAMNSQGVILAHPLFEKHTQNQPVYMYRRFSSAEEKQRFHALKTHIENLVWEPPASVAAGIALPHP